jgi:putative phage-type endonuclease
MSPSSLHPHIEALLKRPDYQQRTDIWYEKRQGLITASDVAAVLGVKPYASYKGDTRAELLQKKLENKPFNNKFVAHGVKYEQECCDLFASLVGEEIMERGLVISEEFPWIGASPDGLALKSGRLLEIKCPLQRTIIPGKVPSHYYHQIQCQMFVCGFDSTFFVQYKPPHLMPERKAFIDIVVVERDPTWWPTHHHALYTFWKELMEAKRTYVKPPDPTCLIDETLYDKPMQDRDDDDTGDGDGIDPDLLLPHLALKRKVIDLFDL